MMNIQVPRLNFAAKTALYPPMLYFVNRERFISNYSTLLDYRYLGNFGRVCTVYISKDSPRRITMSKIFEAKFENSWIDGRRDCIVHSWE